MVVVESLNKGVTLKDEGEKDGELETQLSGTAEGDLADENDAAGFETHPDGVAGAGGTDDEGVEGSR